MVIISIPRQFPEDNKQNKQNIYFFKGEFIMKNIFVNNNGIMAIGGEQTTTLRGGGFHGGEQTTTLPGGGFHA